MNLAVPRVFDQGDQNEACRSAAYNTKLGAAHLGELMEDWKGVPNSYVCRITPGGGNVSKWVKAYGDPRSPLVDPIDWVEPIPFSETRNVPAQARQFEREHRPKRDSSATEGARRLRYHLAVQRHSRVNPSAKLPSTRRLPA